MGSSRSLKAAPGTDGRHGKIMGNTAVAVLHYDCFEEVKASSERMAYAMREMPGSKRPQDFGFGSIISWDHSSGHQVCVVYGNTGWRIGFECEAPDDALKAVAEALREHGWKCTPPKARKPHPDENPSSPVNER
jgi:hypothetical protein